MVKELIFRDTGCHSKSQSSLNEVCWYCANHTVWLHCFRCTWRRQWHL